MYNYVYEQTNEFVDMIRANGYLTPLQYSSFSEKIQMSGNLYEIRLEHKKRYYTPDVANPGQIIAAYEGFYNFDILDQTLFNLSLPEGDRTYLFKKGDYIVVSVINKSETPFETFKSSIGRNSLNNTINVRIGGMINNETN